LPPDDAHHPGIIYGTAWKKAETARLVRTAIQRGFRGIDTACQPKHYDEAGVGAGVALCLNAALVRADLYLQTKFTPVSGQDPASIPYDPAAPLQLRALFDSARIKPAVVQNRLYAHTGYDREIRTYPHARGPGHIRL
jgi:hypothetical protein